MLVPLIGAGLGGFEGYRRSGGDLGAALLGAGLGAVTPAGLRMAGTALGGTALGAKALQGITGLGSKFMGSGAGAQLAKAGIAMPAGPMAPLSAKALGGLAAGGGLLLGAPALAGGLAAAGAKPIGQAAQAASQAVGLGKDVTGIAKPQIEGPAQLGGIPDITSDPGLQGYLATMDPMGRAQATLALQQQYYDQNLANASRASNVTMRFQEAIKDRDFQRSAKAAELSTALATNAAMRQQAQLGAQAMGAGILSGVSQAGATQYRYL